MWKRAKSMETCDQLTLFTNSEALLEAATEQAQKAETPFQESTKLYFIARYFVAIYESRYGEIPIQVWNEYRNALDHFFRRQTTQNKGDDEAKNHLHKMEKHLQRAVLDILKIFVHRTLDSIIEWRENFTLDVYELVDNGKFHPELTSEEKEVRKLFECAKISDSRLGQSELTDGSVLEMYLDAAFQADKIKLMLIDRQGDFETTKSKLSSIHSKAHNLSIKEHFKVHFLFYVFWGALVSVITWLIGEYGSAIKSFFTNFVN